MWSLVTEAEAGRLDVPGFIRYASGLGVEGVELLDVFWKEEVRDLETARQALAESGLPVSAYAIGNDLVDPDSAGRAAQVESIRHGVDLARELNTDLLRVFGGSERPGIDAERGLEWIIGGLAEAAPYAQEQGVVMVLENHGLFSGKAHLVRRIIETVGSPSLRANLDTGNFLLVNEDPLEAVRELAPLAAYVHLKDMRRVREEESAEHTYEALDGSRYQGTVIGEGEVDILALIHVLRRAGYDAGAAWLSVEFEGVGDARAGLEASVRNIRSALESAS
jgi:sugar phosphate isomerase/epimerase